MEEEQTQTERARSKADDDSLAADIEHLAILDGQKPGHLSAANASGGHSVQLSTAFDTAREAFSVLKTSNLLSESDVFESVTSIAKRHKYEKAVFCFEYEIRQIIRKVLNDSDHPKETLWKIMERCYSKSIDPTGDLRYEHYYNSFAHDRTSPNPLDPDSEAKQYNEHQGRLEFDGLDARGFEHNREWENKKQRTEGWKDFWVQLIRACPNGPTLFHPPSTPEVTIDLAEVPQYLFRAYDKDSSGRNDEAVIASEQSAFGKAKLSRDDILSRDKNKDDAANMLCKHLNPSQKYHRLDPPYVKPPNSDNLVSWSSSLLYVVRRAISQSRLGRRNVNICVVDTRQYPIGQFLRDKSLLRAYESVKQAASGFLSFRENGLDFDNGEYLSQGRLYHRGRSCVVSLETLENSGLYKLYPELWRKREDKWEGEWTNFVKDLRNEWFYQDNTRAEEIVWARKSSRICFGSFQNDMALMLLLFRNRGIESTGDLEQYKHYGPIEVQRYHREAETMRSNADLTRDLSFVERLASLYGVDNSAITEG